MRIAFREALLTFKRSPLLSVLGISTIAFSLFSFGLFALVAINMKDAIRQVEDRVEIRAFTADGTPQDAISTSLDDIRAFPEVSDAGYVSPDSALVKSRTELAEFSDVFDATILPGSLEIRINEGFTDPVSVQRLADRIATYPFVTDVQFGEEWVENLHRVRNIVAIVGSGLSIVFAIVSMLIIGSTIRMAILSRAREIEIMRLVGATNSFVRMPFLVEGIIKGALGGALAIGLLWALHRVMSSYLPDILFLTSQQILLGILIGSSLGLISSQFSIGRHLKTVWKDPS